MIARVIFICAFFSSYSMCQETKLVVDTLEQTELIKILDLIEADLSSKHITKLGEKSLENGVSPDKVIRESVEKSLQELLDVSVRYPENSQLRPLYHRLIAKAGTLVSAYDQALDQLMKADELIGNIYESTELVSIELAERYAEIYDDLSTTIFNQWHEDISKDESAEIIMAALGAADRGLFQTALQRHQSNRIRGNFEQDPLYGSMYIPQRFQQLNGSIAALAFEAQKGKNSASVGGVSVVYYQQLEDSLRAWVFYSGNGFAVFNLPASRKQIDLLSRKIRQIMINGIAGVPGASTELNKILSEVGELILPPLEAAFNVESPEIVIIPDGSLNLIPFDALPLEGGDPLIKKTAIRMAPSLAFLKLQIQYLQFGTVKEYMDNGQQHEFENGATTYELIQKRKFDRIALFFNPKTTKNGPIFSNLDNGENEVPETIIKKAVVLKGKNVTENALAKGLSDSKIVHVVAHANSLLGLDNWQSSYIALSPTNDSNGFLTASEILSLPQFNTELIVLSACDSGSGTISSSEGVLALNASLLERGAQTVIASLWPVSDNIPKLTFPPFYREWLSPEFAAKKSKAQALRSAKLQLLSNGLEPWSWAAFQVYGAM